ncbi:lipoprotein-releasing system permease protein [Nonlabens sp. Hel1_33_55]|uniref:ABC transporter permease n=1 Tax=Nonlabens sp. Hel1_33_55 TaxID=1336802 RepID=UPI000875DC18|nr:FtsX-like permease family protein [Nonlabens sp. Hel1_33_55]SCY33939.1 lipoprotein-releasing system permease protein [Nonlabens sp. Hel1_33_55]
MNFPFYIARRYLISKNGKNAINIINILSFIITIVGTTALFIVLSGFSGLKEFSTNFSGYFDPDLQVTAVQGKTLNVPLKRKRALENIEGIQVLSEVIEEKAFLSYAEKNDIAFIKGVPDNYDQIVAPDSILMYGSWLTDNDPQVVIGAGIKDDLSIGINDYSTFIQIMVPRPGTNAINAMNLSRSFSTLDAIATGMFSVNEDLDNKYIFMRLSAARTLLNYSDSTVTALELKLTDPDLENDVRDDITALFDVDLEIKNKLQLNGALYKMLNSENLAVYLIFTLVLIIALFNVVGSIIMMILDKKKNLKTLADLGAEVGQLRLIFFLQGTLMTLSGGIIGLLIGMGFVYGQIAYKWIYIAPGIPYPFSMEFLNVAVSLLTIAVLGIIASYIGSRRINDRLLSQAKL